MWPASKSSTYVIWPDEKGYDAAYFGFPEARNASGLRKYLTGLHRERRAGAPYVCPTWASTQLPAWASHGNEWGKGPRESLRESRWGGEFVQVCPASTSWLNVARPSYAKFIQDYRLTAIYLDNAQAYVTRGCLNPEESGAAVEFPMLGQRRIYRAIVQDLRQNGPQTDAVVHSSGGINLPSFSMVDSLVTGEHYRGVVKDDYLDVASLTDFRIELNSQRWGLTTHFLPEFPQGIRDAVLPTRKLMAILLLHDVRPWPKWCNVGEVNRALAAIDLFGVSDASFVAYYVTSPLAVSKAGQLKISGYQDGDRTLLIAANLTKAAVDGQICLADRLSSPTVQVETWPKPTPLALNHGCINVSVDPGDYALFRIASRSSAAPLH